MDCFASLAMTWNHLGLNNTRPVDTGTPENFFIIFVDRIFTTLIERPFTNVFDASREITGNP
jgi:hypothetical protein